MADQSHSIDGFKVPAAPKRSAPKALPPLKYDEPATAAPPSTEYTLEVIKAGTQLESHTIEPNASQTYYLFGRLPHCDFSMEHESISRYHAVLQFHQNNTANLVDLNSSHGTFVNKHRISTQTLQSGDQIRFGMSSRIWIFNSPSQEKQQSEESVPRSPQHKNEDKRLRKFLRKHLDKDEYSWTITKEDGQTCCSIVIDAFKDQEDNSLAARHTSLEKEEAEQTAAHKMLMLLDHYGFMDMYQNTSNRYESSEDEYYDHTIRSKTPQVETSDTLKHKLESVALDLAKAQSELAQIKVVGSESRELDELDRYMADLNQKEQQQLRSQLVKQIDGLLAHQDRLKSLLQIVAPETSSDASPQKVIRSSSPPKGPPAVESPPTNTDNVATSVRAEEMPAPKRKRAYGPTRKELEQRHVTRPTSIAPAEDSSSTWQPPAGQSGDGKTSLNDKYGY
ncbi:hypothetical protein IWW40_000446 [Coemansia sp. RSA 1250]|nr:hypothetical protein IWW40_000446 [Coemansia sp. RSA 1250]